MQSRKAACGCVSALVTTGSNRRHNRRVFPFIARPGLCDDITATDGAGSASGFPVLTGKRSPLARLVSELDREGQAVQDNGR